MEKVVVDALGDTCPVPVVKAKKAIKGLSKGGEVEILVDNETSVQNLTKMADQKGFEVSSKKLGDKKYQVNMLVNEGEDAEDVDETLFDPCALPTGKKNTVVQISSRYMGSGDDKLGGSLMKAFIYALTQQDVLPETMLFYNGGAYLTCEGSDALEDLKELSGRGVRILTCGTCLNFYDITQKLSVGEVTNMYDIVEILEKADRIIRP